MAYGHKKTRKPFIFWTSGSRSGGIRTRGLLVPNSKISFFFRPFPEISVNCRFFPFLPAYSACFWKFRSSFILDIRPFLHFEKCNPWLQPPRLQHPPWPCLAAWSNFWFVVWFHAHLHGQISERLVVLRAADRAMLQERVQQLLLSEIEVTLLFLGIHRFVFHHFALSFTIITGMYL